MFGTRWARCEDIDRYVGRRVERDHDEMIKFVILEMLDQKKKSRILTLQLDTN